MRLRRMQHSGTHCVAFFGTRGRQGIRHPRSIYDRRLSPPPLVVAGGTDIGTIIAFAGGWFEFKSEYLTPHL
jgi:hypothetical protein